MTEWINIKDHEVPPEDTLIWASWRNAQTRETGVHLIGRWTKESAHFTDKEFSYTHWALVSSPSVPPPPPLEVPKDGKTYACWHIAYGHGFIAWLDHDHYFFTSTCHNGKLSSISHILRYMDEKGKWVDRDE